MATAEKLSQLLKTKAAIKAVIEEKGETVGDVPFRLYAELISGTKSIAYPAGISAINALLRTKTAIRFALESKGAVMENTPFRQYADKIQSLVFLGKEIKFDMNFNTMENLVVTGTYNADLKRLEV